MDNRKQTIESGKAVLGIELGSTRIKAVLIDENHTPIASGSCQWENRLALFFPDGKVRPVCYPSR